MLRSAVQGILRTAVLVARQALGLPTVRHTEDRRVLEQVILPAYARRTDIRRVLFVGCASYTKHYAELFLTHEYWTLDPVPGRRRYGGQRHIVDGLHNLGAHVQNDYFDLIICNGVLGWGLNVLDEVNLAFAACHRHLRAGGELMLGWNDIAPRNRVVPEQVAALRDFEPRTFDPLGTATLRLSAVNRHVFSFYKKPVDLSS